MNAPARPLPLLGTALLGGGARAAYQVGVLAWISERMPRLTLPLIEGVSAGAANAMGIASSGNLAESLSRLREGWQRLSPEEIFDSFPSGRSYSLFGCLREMARRVDDSRSTFQGLFDDRPIRRFVSSCSNFEGLRENISSGRLHAVALTASSYDTGKSVTFFQGRASLGNWIRDHGSGVATTLTIHHVMASGAIPLLFPPVRIGGRLYGDGNVRQQFPLSPLIRLGADRLLVIDPGPSSRSVQTRGAASGSLAETLGLLLDSMVVDRIEGDVARLSEINESLEGRPRPKEGEDRRRIEFLLLRPKLDVGTLAAGLGPPRSRTLRLLSRAAGGWDERVAGLLSYLWVDPRFTNRLFDLGYADARERGREIEVFLSPSLREESPMSRAAG
jgi:NTE family protein